MSAHADSAPLRVLIVDDCPDTVSWLAELGRLWGHRTCVAHDGESALRVAGECRPDAVILDVGLPDMPGWELAARLRGVAGMEDTMMVALSGYFVEADRRLLRQSGCDIQPLKPIRAAELKSLLDARQGRTPGGRPL
jgi:DNA-binding response OmpR family regulator